MAVNRGALKVLLLADAVAFHTERFAHQLQLQGCEVMTASLEPGEMEHHSLRGRGPIKALHYLSTVPSIRRLIRQFNPDVINPHFASGYGFTAALARQKPSLPIVLNLWGSDVLIVPHKSFLHQWKTRHALRAADFVIGDSEHLLSAAESITELNAARVIPWGIEREFLSLHKTDYRFQKPHRIIVPRTQAPVYNNDFILRALQPLLSDGRVQLTFPSFGVNASKFREQVAPYLGQGVRLYDRKPRDQFLKFVAEHDVYLSASRSDSSPASLIEAMALGLFPIAADIPGVREWLTDENARLYPQDDAQALQSVVRELVEQKDDFGAVRRANLDRVRKDAIFESNVAAQIEIMRKLAEAKT
jgi:glycosyltransferase involved in cell wall biosynthesis